MQVNSKFPWLFSGKGTYRDCRSYMAIFNAYGIIPMRCRHFCWKVVIRVETYDDLLRLQSYLADFHRINKCGFDRRDYTDDRYIGFIYCDSKEDAEDIFFEILQDLSWAKAIDYKRGCTEMRLKVPVETWDEIKPRQLQHNTDFKHKIPLNRRKEVLENWQRWEGETQ